MAAVTEATPLRRRTTLLLAAGLLASRAARAQGTGQGTAQGTGQGAGQDAAAATAVPTGASTRSHGLSLIGQLALPADFPYFPWVDPDAPKDGEVALAAVGTFDSFNPFIVRGTAGGVGAVWDSLLQSNANEAASAYGHLAQVIELANDGSWVAFEIRPEARFHDGSPVTADDVAWTFTALMQHGRPFYRAYYADVAEVKVESPRRVLFRLKSTENKELPQDIGEMAVLPRGWWDGRDFERPLTDPPMGSGPYQLDRFEFGRTLVLKRVPDWWAAKLPTGIGLHNFASMRTEYFRDATVALQAFKAGQIDFRQENIAKDWATAYDFPARQRGLVKLDEIRHHLPTGMQGFAMNVRRPLFADRRVRQALAWAFDFEWANKNLFYDAYTRTRSYFSNSDLASSGLPAGDELALLQPHKDHLPPELFTQEFTLPVTDGSGNNRDELRRALELCRAAGWQVKERRMLDAAGNPVSFEILLDSPTYERVALPYVQSLGRLGIEARVRTVDPAQYQRLTDAFDYDMTMTVFAESEHPGNEQMDYWGSQSAKAEGSNNLVGVADPVVDALVAKVIGAPDYQHLLTATHALDRVLLWNWYVVPHWHLQSFRVAYWDRFGRPDKPVRAGLVFDSWWVDPKLAAATDAARQAG